MAARADSLTIASFPNAYTDRGVSDDALALRNLLRQVFRIDSPSISIEGRFRDALEALRSVSEEASQDNWDGYGARKADLSSFVHARSFLLALPTTIPLPEVAIDPDGEVSLTWQRGQRYVFSVSISGEGLLSYAGLFGRNRTHGTEDFIHNIPKAIATNLERLFSTQA